MCPTCKKSEKLFTLLVSAGLLLWLSALFCVGAVLLH